MLLLWVTDRFLLLLCSLVWVTVISRFIIFSGTGFHFLAKTILNCIGRVKSVLPWSRSLSCLPAWRDLLIGDFTSYILIFCIGYSDNYDDLKAYLYKRDLLKGSICRSC